MGHKPNNPRKKREKNMSNSRPAATNPLVQQHKTPEGRAKYLAMIRKVKSPGRPLGVPDGHTKKTIAPIVDQAKADAKKVVEIMKKQYDIEDPRAEEALETAVEIMRTPVHNRDRLQAAKLILDFTKVKPVAKSEVVIGNAEAFLSSLLDDTGDNSDGNTGSTS